MALLLAAACGSSAPVSAHGRPDRSSEASRSPVAAAGCPSPHPLSGGRAVSADYADLVVHDGRTFLNTALSGGPPEAVAPGDVGSVVFRVSCELSAFTASGQVEPPPLTEGASGQLPAGTEVHAVAGFPTRCRLTARRDGRWVAYLAQTEVNRVSATLPCALHAGP